MQSVAELTLPHLSLEDPVFAVDPMPFIEAARRQHPWLARCSFGYVVHEYQAIRDLSYMDDKLRPSMDTITEIMGAKGTPWGEFMDNLMLAKTGAEHARLRSSVEASFTPKNINRYRALMRDRVSQLLDEWAPRGAFDFAEFAAYFPISVMFGLIGASPAALPSIRKSLETQGLSANLIRSLLPDLEAAYQVLWSFVHDLIVERQRDGGGDEEDVLNTLIAGRAAGKLDEGELHNLMIFLFAAGYDTSKNMLTLIMHMMLKHPQYWARCAEDRPFCDQVVREMLRHTSVSSLYRMTTQDVIYRGVLFPCEHAAVHAAEHFRTRSDRIPGCDGIPSRAAGFEQAHGLWPRRAHLSRPAFGARADPGRHPPDRSTHHQAAPGRRGDMAALPGRLGHPQLCRSPSSPAAPVGAGITRRSGRGGASRPFCSLTRPTGQ